MAMRCLSPRDGGASGRVTIPKNLLALDDLLDEDGLVERQSIHVQRHGRGRYTIQVLDE